MQKYFTFKRITLIALASLMVVTSAPGLVLAVDDKGFFGTNDIIFYSSEKSCVAGSSGALVAGDGTNPKTVEEVKKVIWGFLLGKGLSPEQTAGLMGNIQQESGFRPEAVEGGNGIGFGIVQWSFGRRTNLEAAAAKQGVPASSLAFQLEYMFQESTARTAIKLNAIPPLKWGGSSYTGSEWEGMKQQPDVISATLYWHGNFERSADDVNKLSNRIKFAEAILADPNINTVGPTGSAKCGVADTSSFMSTVKSYAWPEYHPHPYTAMQPAYVTALNKAKAEGRYIGGDATPGIDCGGFVTTLMIDSKYEPGYNYEGLFAKGAGITDTQEKWLQANWEVFGKGNAVNVVDLKAGDVAMQPGHTFVFVGDKGNKPEGFDGIVASASIRGSGSVDLQRAPMAGRENPNQSDITWYRKKTSQGGSSKPL